MIRKTYVLISYDITEDKTRTRLAKRLKDFGKRAQYSVFEAEITPAEMKNLRQTLARVKLGPRDSIRLYVLCGTCRTNISLWGSGEIAEDPDYVII